MLLDTHILLWWISNSEHSRIGARTHSIIADPRNEVFVSAASTWEIAIKTNLGALNAPEDMERVIEDKGFSKLHISVFHSQKAGGMLDIIHPKTNKPHKDPFDRMLVAQSQAEGLELVTCDSVFPAYNIQLIDGST